ncbi:hypothetical protein M0812_10125 [Anaeramoeba flamelloides]|uniref:Piezo non-specific cation channel R-Ras-binding domain-containing protein n=1 Tax=Anaeramoeba flamelloides TaxID=1746091 RepID=A0AAV7ZUV0_9EUKA|nr:hypothetical protein M0812_10125 [Anaeramoeba flamelloides]
MIFTSVSSIFTEQIYNNRNKESENVIENEIEKEIEKEKEKRKENESENDIHENENESESEIENESENENKKEKEKEIELEEERKKKKKNVKESENETTKNNRPKKKMNKKLISLVQLIIFFVSICLLIFWISLNPCILTLPIWLVCGISVIFPFLFNYLISVISIYVLSIYLIQYIFNIDFGWDSSEILQDIGFTYFENSKFFFGFGIFTISFLFFQNRIINNFKKLKDNKDSNQIIIYENQNSESVDEFELDFEKQQNTDNDTTYTKGRLLSTDYSSDSEDIQWINPNLQNNKDNKNKMNKNKNKNKNNKNNNKSGNNSDSNSESYLKETNSKRSKKVKIQFFQIIRKIIIRFFFGYSYYLSLFIVVISSLNNITILNSVFMIFFVIFILSKKIARRYWIFLVIYSELVLLTMFLWNFSFISNNTHTESNFIYILGVYSDSNFSSFIFWNILITLFSIIQFHINQRYRQYELNYEKLLGLNNKKNKKKTTKAGLANKFNKLKKKMTIANMKQNDLFYDQEQANNLAELKIIKTFNKYYNQFFYQFGEHLSYIIILLFCIYTRVSLIHWFYLFITFICFLIHSIIHNSKKLIFFFYVLTISVGITVLARYSFQFDYINDKISNKFDTDSFYQDLGLIKYKENPWKIILPQSILLIYLVSQLTFMKNKSKLIKVNDNWVEDKAKNDNNIVNNSSNNDDDTDKDDTDSHEYDSKSDVDGNDEMKKKKKKKSLNFLNNFSDQTFNDLLSSETLQIMEEENLMKKIQIQFDHQKNLKRYIKFELSKFKFDINFDQMKKDLETVYKTQLPIFIEFIKRFIFLYSFQLYLFVCFFVSIYEPNLLNFIFLLFSIFTIILKSNIKKIWPIIFIYSCLIILTTYLYHFNYFSDYHDDKYLKYIGFEMSYVRREIKGTVWILITLRLAQQVNYYKKQYYPDDKKLTLFLEKENIEETETFELIINHTKNFFNNILLKFGMIIVNLTLLIVAFLNNSIFGILCIIILIILTTKKKLVNIKTYGLLIFLFSLTLLSRYLIILGFPPFIENVETSLSNDMLIWLDMKIEKSTYLTGDFFLIFFLSLTTKSWVLKKRELKLKYQKNQKKKNHQSLKKGSHEYMAFSSDDSNNSNHEKINYNVDYDFDDDKYSIENLNETPDEYYKFSNNSTTFESLFLSVASQIKLILIILIFLFAIPTKTLFNFVYVVFTMYFLNQLNKLTIKHYSKSYANLRNYLLFISFIYIFFTAPFIPTSEEKFSYRNIFGLNAVDPSDRFSLNGALSHIFIYLFISLLIKFSESKYFKGLLEYQTLDLKQVTMRSIQLKEKEFYQSEFQKMESTIAEKNRQNRYTMIRKKLDQLKNQEIESLNQDTQDQKNEELEKKKAKEKLKLEKKLSKKNDNNNQNGNDNDNDNDNDNENENENENENKNENENDNDNDYDNGNNYEGNDGKGNEEDNENEKENKKQQKFKNIIIKIIKLCEILPKVYKSVIVNITKTFILGIAIKLWFGDTVINKIEKEELEKVKEKEQKKENDDEDNENDTFQTLEPRTKTVKEFKKNERKKMKKKNYNIFREIIRMKRYRNPEKSLTLNKEGIIVKKQPSHLFLLLCSIYYFLLNNTEYLCYFGFILVPLNNPSIISLVYPTLLFCLALFFQPSKKFWQFLITYTQVIIAITFFFQLDILCFCYLNQKWGYYSILPDCEKVKCQAGSESFLEYFVGFDKSTNSFFSIIWDNILILILMILHRSMLLKKGRWDQENLFDIKEKDNDKKTDQDQSQDKGKNNKKKKTFFSIFKKKKKKQIQKKENENQKKRGKGKGEGKKRGKGKGKRKGKRKGKGKGKGKGKVKEIEKEKEKELLKKKDYLWNNNNSKSTNSTSSEDELQKNSKKKNSEKPLNPISKKGLLQKTQTDRDNKYLSKVMSDLRKDNKDNIDQERLLEIMKRKKEKNQKTGKFKIIKQILDPLSKIGKDFYTICFFIDVITLVHLAMSYQNWSEAISGDLSSYLSSGQMIPLNFVLILILQFSLIVFDRTFYLFNTLTIKLIYQFISVIIHWLIIFVIIPYNLSKKFTEIPSLVFLYLLKCGYFFFSGFQIRFGYPPFTSGNILMRTYSGFSKKLFTIYMVVPFIFELRVILDWMCTKTTLKLVEFIRFHAIHGKLFLLKCKTENEDFENYKPGKEMRVKSKIIMSVVALILIVFLIFGPILLMSSGEDLTKNTVLSIGTEFGIEGFQPMYHAELLLDGDKIGSNKDILQMCRGRKDSLDSDYFQEIKMSKLSESFWGITPSGKEDLIDGLRSGTVDTFYIEYKFYSEFVTGNDQSFVREYFFSHTFSTNEANNIADLLETNEDGEIAINNFVPEVIYISNFGDVEEICDQTLDGSLILSGSINNTNANTKYWGISTDADSVISYYIRNADVPKSSFSQMAASMGGIAGLYIGVVWAAAKFLREYVNSLSGGIMEDELPNVDMILSLMEDTLWAQKEQNLILEELLYDELIDILRSSEKLIRITGTRAKRGNYNYSNYMKNHQN